MPPHPPLRFVDATRPPGAVRRAYAALAATRPVLFLSRHISWKVDPLLLRLTRGRLATSLMFPTAVLETTGARTGERRRNAVIYWNDGDRITIAASQAGSPRNPSWYHNLLAHPDVVFGGIPMRAEVVPSSDHDRLWTLGDRVLPSFASYRRKAAAAGRSIPLIQLTPAFPDGTARLGAMDVRQRWVGAGGADEDFDDVVARYGEPHRAYHTMHHVEHVLGKVDEIGQGHDPAVVLAAILHDVIYAPERVDNEDRSADYARRVLADHDAVERIAMLIEATKSHDGAEGDEGLDALLDADLSTFADDDEGKNGDLIRQEYAAVPADAFRAGRRRILQQFLDREPLYRTELMRTRYEAKAKANIRRAIDRIGSD
jgi:deazaflavin-dependent oxidoreductase (nitroreductase family)